MSRYTIYRLYLQFSILTVAGMLVSSLETDH